MPPLTILLASSPTLTLSLLSSLSYTILLPSRPSPSRTATKTLSTILLALTIYLNPSSPALLTAGLALSSLGDFFLALSDTSPPAEPKPKSDDDDDPFFLLGLSSFLTAHLLYTRLFLLQPGATPLPTLLTTSPAAWTLTALITTMLLVLIPRAGGELRVPVAVYAAAIYVMGLSALALPEGKEGVVAGAMMFTASDAVLAVEKFVVGPGRRRWMGYVVWGLYYGGQVLIAVGF
ncbi:YhhN-like protein [Schizothecium vesticola]|uniref:YhhN-like protein n=1 Tax=Schizothecium vesticola TaxID=314040 RepID=A0AA40F8K1_9PEZI|nr:YhhN-like protein [Schizothecium vesticola]